MDDSRLVLEKYSELVDNKWTFEHRLNHCTPAERAIWLVLEIHLSIELDGFSSVFEQALTRSEILEAVSVFQQLHSPQIADSLLQALTLLDRHCDYGQLDSVILGAWQVCDQVTDSIDNIGDHIYSSPDWGLNIEKQLADMLRSER
jgi:hypothetical protein